MAQNYKPRFASSGSNKRPGDPAARSQSDALPGPRSQPAARPAARPAPAASSRLQPVRPEPAAFSRSQPPARPVPAVPAAGRHVKPQPSPQKRPDDEHHAQKRPDGATRTHKRPKQEVRAQKQLANQYHAEDRLAEKHPERQHLRASRQAQTSGPRVLDPSGGAPPAPQRGGKGPRRTQPQSAAAGHGAQGKGARSITGGSARREQQPGGGQVASRSAQARAAREAREARSRTARRHGPLFYLLIPLSVLLVLGAGLVALYASALFPLNTSDIQVVGASRLRMDYVRQLAAVPEDSTFFRTDTAGIAGRLVAEPWIEDAWVEVSFPETIVLHITEQQVAAVVDIVPASATEQVQHWLISASGTWLTEMNNNANPGVQMNAEQFVKFPKIKDVAQAVHPVAGEREQDKGVLNALKMLEGFSVQMRDLIASVSAPDATKTTLTLYNNVVVAVGEAIDVAAKEQAIATLLAEHPGTLTYINVRVADRATYRATE